MAKLFLPVGSKPSLYPDNERAELMNRLWDARYWVPGAKDMEIQQLRDYVDYAEYRVKEDEEKEAKLAAEKINKMSPEQVRGALNEFFEWRRAKLRSQGLLPQDGYLGDDDKNTFYT